jgi:tRNA A64-2'-O-ribosylphosphate transferase
VWAYVAGPAADIHIPGDLTSSFNTKKTMSKEDDIAKPQALTEADLIFSGQANHNFSRILGDLKRSNLSLTNRLKSIRHDADFANRVAEAYRRPLVANERCGSWYLEPSRKAASAYFKSTDGHTGQWQFSTRRLNLHLLPLIDENDG